jgi:hypothetical protein
LTTDLEKDRIKSLLRELYIEALNEETTWVHPRLW